MAEGRRRERTCRCPVGGRFPVEEQPSGKLGALGGRTRNEEPKLVSNSVPGRFEYARAIWRLTQSDGPFLITSARTLTQQAERAFAAELLAPADGIKTLLPPQTSVIDPGTFREIAREFEVQESVVEHQIQNRLSLDVVRDDR